MSYRRRPEHELIAFSDEKLIAQMVAARDAGASDDAGKALSILAYRHFDRLKWKARMRLPSEDDAEDVAQQTLKGMLGAAFDGESVGEAVSLMNTILERRIADFHRSRKGKETEPLPDHSSEEDGPRPEVAISHDETGRVDVQDVIDSVYGRIGKQAHRMVVDRKVFQNYSAEETAKAVNRFHPDLDPPMSAQNADQIASRFRADLRKALEAAENP